jgi:transketolase
VADDTPAVLVFTRQNLPVLDGSSLSGGLDTIHAGVARGGYVLADSDGAPDVILISSGSEVHIAHAAYKTLTAQGVKARVVSLPCWEVFERQDAAYRDSVLPPAVTARVSIEAGVTTGWQKWIGAKGIAIGVDRFGASAPYQKIYEEYGLTPDAVVAAAKLAMK